MYIVFDMYGVIIVESKGYFRQYVHERYPDTSPTLFRELYEKASRNEIGSDEFFAGMGFPEPEKAMRDYIENYLTFDEGFIGFCERYKNNFAFALLSNDVLAWSDYIRELHGIEKYFTHCITSASTGIRKPDPGIFKAAITELSVPAGECVFIDNSVANLRAAEAFGMKTVLFNRDGEQFDGDIVYSFEELSELIGRKYL